MQIISIDFAATRIQVNRLHESAQSIRTSANANFDSAVNALRANWTGESAAFFYRKCSELHEKLLAAARDLDAAADAIDRKAYAVYQAEQEAKRIAMTIGGGGGGGGGGGR